MRFTNNFNIFKTLQVGSQRLLRIVTMPVYGIWRKLQHFINPNGIMTKVMGDVRKAFKKLISERPSSLKDYFGFPRYYVAKKLVFVAILLLLLLPVLYMQFLHPVVQAKFLTKTMYVNAAEMQGYTGHVKLLWEDSDELLYKGVLENGRVTGEGTLYDAKGRLVYTGGFLMEMYEGDGESYYPNGKTQYKGTFAKNQYDGSGILYTRAGSIKYEGGFAGGLYDGDGKLYYDNGTLMFGGAFAGGQMSGFGTIYSPTGQIIYTGDLQDGRFEGNGIVYENGEKLYEGELAGGKLNGKGIIYSGKNIIYDGEFSEGTYGGKGKSYDPITKALIYDGEFENGQYCGKGKLFDIKGGLIYDGEFYNGSYEGAGKLFEPGTEMPIYEGNFRTGRYDGDGVEYAEGSGSLLYEGSFLLGAYNGKGILYDPSSGAVADEGVFLGGGILLSSVPVPEEGAAGSEDAAAGGSQAGDGSETPGDKPGDKPGTKPGDKPGTKPGDKPGTKPGDKPTGETGQVYSGPKSGEAVDYQALAAMTTEKIVAAFADEPSEWELDQETAMVYEDAAEGIGITVHKDTKGKQIGIDIWNDGLVSGISPGMTKAAMTQALGQPVEEKQEVMGEGRMVSVSQSNRFHGRLTNLSAESNVEVVTYKIDKGVLRAIFLKGDERALILEVRDK